MQKLLLLEEQYEASEVNTTNLPMKPSDCGVSFNSVIADWTVGDSRKADPTLHNLSFACKPGELTVIVGPVGAGKTSVLMTILNELQTCEGEVEVRGRISYASQEPCMCIL